MNESEALLNWDTSRKIRIQKGKNYKGNPQSSFTNKSVVKLKSEIIGISRKYPQVIVKITGGGRSIKGIKAHMVYISQGDKVLLENEEGDNLSKKDIAAELKSWNESEAIQIIEDETGLEIEKTFTLKNGKKSNLPPKEAINFMLSMPKGTDAIGLRKAALAVIQEEFKGHRYVLGLHIDKDHPHVHVCVKSRSEITHKRMNPKKSKIAGMREKFADQLMMNGIAATATFKAQRGSIKYSKYKHKGKILIKENNERNLTERMRNIDAAEKKELDILFKNLEKSNVQKELKKYLHDSEANRVGEGYEK